MTKNEKPGRRRTKIFGFWAMQILMDDAEARRDAPEATFSEWYSGALGFWPEGFLIQGL